MTTDLLCPSLENFIRTLFESLRKVIKSSRKEKTTTGILDENIISYLPPCWLPSHGALRRKTATHAQFKKREKTKMADEGRVCVDSKQSVLRIHEKLKKAVHGIAEKKSWSTKQKEEFEKNLLEVRWSKVVIDFD